MALWANQQQMFAIAEPFDQNNESNGNGTMVGFNVDSSEEVDRLYEKVLYLGRTREGKPTIFSGMYSAYIKRLR